MPNTRKMKWGGLLIASLALAASLIVAPLGAYAADVPKPKFKDTYTVESAERAVCRSLSGKYIVFNEDNNGHPGDYGTVLNVEDGTQKRVKMSLENSWDGYCCFSSDEKTLYAYDEDSLSVTAYDLNSNKSKTYKLGSSVIADGGAWRFQLSEDGKSFLFISFLSGSRSIQFCKYNFEKDEIEEQFAIDDDTLGVDYSYLEVERDDYWLSSDGMYGYIVFDGSEDGKSCNKIVTYDLDTASIANIVSVELDTESSYGTVYPLGLCFSGIPITSDKGTLLNNGALLSKNGEITNDAVCGLSEPDDPNEDDGICSVNSSGSLALIAQGNDTSSDKVAVYDCASGKQGEKVKPSSPVGAYGSLSNDGRYVLGIDNNDKMVLLDLNKNVASKTPLKSEGGLWFADDDTLVCSTGHAEKGIRVDVYKSNIARSPLKTASSGKAEESFLLSPVIIVAIVGALAVVVIVVVFVVRRKMASCVATDSQSTPLESASDSHINPTRQQDLPRFRGEQQFQQAATSMDGPRFCASCGTPLVSDAKFCPHCGAPIKR